MKISFTAAFPVMITAQATTDTGRYQQATTDIGVGNRQQQMPVGNKS
jgi:hypothetical protein